MAGRCAGSLGGRFVAKSDARLLRWAIWFRIEVVTLYREGNKGRPTSEYRTCGIQRLRCGFHFAATLFGTGRSFCRIGRCPDCRVGRQEPSGGSSMCCPDNISPAMVKADCFRFRLNQERVQPQFAALQLTATASAASAVLSTGATRQRTNLQATLGRAIGVPAVPEQSLIVEYVAAELSGIRRAGVAVRKEIDLLIEYRSRLIADVVTGKLDVRSAVAELSGEDILGSAGESAEESKVEREVTV